MTCLDKKDNAGQSNHNNSRISSFLNIVFYWNNNLKLFFSLADTAVKKQVKLFN